MGSFNRNPNFFEASEHPHLGLTFAKAYLSAYDPAMLERMWSSVIEKFSSQGKPATQDRKKRAFDSSCFDYVRHKKLLQTTAEDFFQVLNADGVAANHFLRCLHNMALGLGWLPGPIIPSKLWPVAPAKPKRGITWEEQQTILASEQNAERRLFYRLLWEIGTSQTDTVMLNADNVDWERKLLAYQRQKTGQWAQLTIALKRQATKTAFKLRRWDELLVDPEPSKAGKYPYGFKTRPRSQMIRI